MSKIFRSANIPNAICILRILMVVPVAIALLGRRFELALLLTVLAAISDGLDGFLARRFGWVSRIGGLLDPLADKLLFLTVFISLAWVGLVPVWLAGIVIGRDLVIVTGALCYEYLIGELRPQPSLVSKLNTLLALTYIFFVITLEAYGWPNPAVVIVNGAGVMVVSVVSGIDYVLHWAGMARRARAG